MVRYDNVPKKPKELTEWEEKAGFRPKAKPTFVQPQASASQPAIVAAAPVEPKAAPAAGSLAAFGTVKLA